MRTIERITVVHEKMSNTCFHSFKIKKSTKIDEVCQLNHKHSFLIKRMGCESNNQVNFRGIAFQAVTLDQVMKMYIYLFDTLGNVLAHIFMCFVRAFFYSQAAIGNLNSNVKNKSKPPPLKHVKVKVWQFLNQTAYSDKTFIEREYTLVKRWWE